MVTETKVSKELIGILAVGAALAGLIPVERASVKADIREVRLDVGDLRERTATVETLLDSIDDRLGRIEDSLYVIRPPDQQATGQSTHGKPTASQ